MFIFSKMVYKKLNPILLKQKAIPTCINSPLHSFPRSYWRRSLQSGSIQGNQNHLLILRRSLSFRTINTTSTWSSNVNGRWKTIPFGLHKKIEASCCTISINQPSNHAVHSVLLREPLLFQRADYVCRGYLHRWFRRRGPCPPQSFRRRSHLRTAAPPRCSHRGLYATRPPSYSVASSRVSRVRPSRSPLFTQPYRHSPPLIPSIHDKKKKKKRKTAVFFLI